MVFQMLATDLCTLLVFSLCNNKKRKEKLWTARRPSHAVVQISTHLTTEKFST